MIKKKLEDKQAIINKTLIVTSFLLIIILNVDGFKDRVKRYRVAEWIFYKRFNNILPIRNHLRFKVIYRLKMKK